MASTQQRYRNTPSAILPRRQVKAPLRPYLAGNERAMCMRVRPLSGRTGRLHAIPVGQRSAMNSSSCILYCWHTDGNYMLLQLVILFQILYLAYSSDVFYHRNPPTVRFDELCNARAKPLMPAATSMKLKILKLQNSGRDIHNDGRF